MSKTLLTTGLMLASIMAPQALEAAGKCDLVPWMIKSPGIRARQTQPLILEIYNAGDAPSGAYTVGFKLDGELIGETHFDEGVPLWGDCDVMVEGSVTLEYGRTYQVEAYVNTDEPDGNPSNNTITSTFTMPDAPAPNYPYYWDDATCLQDFTYDSEGWSFAWGFDYNTNAFYISERASNWFGSLTTTKPITFAEGDVVTCSFDYGTSGGAVKLVLAENSQYYSEPFAEQLLPESPVDFSHATISFVAPGPMTVDLYPELQADFYTYGAFFIRNICFAPAAPDMATDAILSPQFQAVACSTDPIDVVVRYTNNGAFDIEAPIFSYSYEGQTVDETYGGTFAAGSSIDYHFHTPIMAVTVTDEAELSAWCTSADDSDASNNRINTSFSIYEPVSFPYATDFQDDPTIDLWSTLDSDGNGWTWDFTQAGYYGGPVLICDYGKFDDYLIMPAVQMPAGRSRFTFGYWNMFSAARMRVLMGRTPSISAMTDVICDYNLVNGIEGYALLDIEEPGLYYFAFEGIGSADQLLITDVSLDRGNGVAVNGIAYEAQDGYSLTTSPVSIQVVNHGVDTKNDIRVFYEADGMNAVIETIAQELKPGESLTYTFQQLADVSEYGKHTIFGGVLPEDGEDDNLFTTAWGVELNNYTPLTAPYIYGFNDEQRNNGWTLQSDGEYMGNGWNVEEGNFFANSHHTDIIASYCGDGRCDYWAFSEGVMLTAGLHEVGFYYRGRSYFGGEDYMQDFDVALGQGNTAEAMTIPVVSFRDLDSHGCYFDRYVTYVNIPEDGVWNIGFHDVSISNYGQIRIDDVSIRAVEPGLSLPYLSDFRTDATDQWTFHGNDTFYATQWSYKNSTLTCTHDGYDGAYYENIATSPKLNVEPGREVTVNIKYKVNRISGKAPDLDVYLGKFASMKQMEVIATLPASKQEAEFSFTADEAEGLYLGIRSATDISEEDPSFDGNNYTITIKSVDVSYSDADAIELLPASATGTDYYNLQGQRSSADVHGLTIIRREGAPALKVIKL